MDKNDPVFMEYCGYWQLSEEMIAKASKDELAEVARILAMQSAHLTRKYGVQELPDLAHLLSATTLDDDQHETCRGNEHQRLIEYIESGNQAAAIELTCMHLNAIEQLMRGESPKPIRGAPRY